MERIESCLSFVWSFISRLFFFPFLFLLGLASRGVSFLNSSLGPLRRPEGERERERRRKGKVESSKESKRAAAVEAIEEVVVEKELREAPFSFFLFAKTPKKNRTASGTLLWIVFRLLLFKHTKPSETP